LLAVAFVHAIPADFAPLVVGFSLRVFGHATSKVSSIGEKPPTEGIEQNYCRQTLADASL
jgi:hypothetical protein